MKRGYWLLIIVVVLIVIGLILLGLFLPRAPITVEDDSILVEKNIGSLEYSSKQQGFEFDTDTACGEVVKLESSGCITYQTEYRLGGLLWQEGVRVIISVHDRLEDTAISKINAEFAEVNPRTGRISPTIVDGNKVYIGYNYFGSYSYWLSDGKEILVHLQAYCHPEFIDSVSETREFEGRKISDEDVGGFIKLCSAFDDVTHRYLIKYPSDL